MILIWFSYGFGVSPFFDMILIWFSYGFGVSPFSWYNFLMVLECLRLFDMIFLWFFLWFWGASVFLIWFRCCFRPATSPTPVFFPSGLADSHYRGGPFLRARFFVRFEDQTGTFFVTLFSPISMPWGLACPEVFCSNSHGLATLELETCIEACLQLYFIF